MPKPKPYIDVMIIVPIAEELKSLFEIFEYEADVSDENFQINQLKSPTNEISIYMIKLREQGNVAAREACNYFLEKFSVGLIVCYGIAGAVKKDVKLADVCVSHRILDFTDQSKLEESNDDTSISYNVKQIEVERTLCTRLAFLSENPAYRSLREEWQEACLEIHLNFESDYPLEYGIAKKYIREEPRIFFGPIISYIVIASQKFANTISKTHRNALAVETESSGAFEVANRLGIPIITVRGISDFADSAKNKFELDTGDQVRYVAARNAANYIKYQIMSPTIVSFLKDRKIKVNDEEMKDLFDSESSDTIQKLLIDIEEQIDEQLREKCPAYVHKRKGSILPAPRLQRLTNPQTLEKAGSWNVPQELASVIETYSRVTISLEPTYPDRALPWVIADNILRTNGERLYIPIVVPGENVSPNRFKVAKLKIIQRINMLGIDGAIPVIIIDDPNLQSNTRSRALIEEANRESVAKFIVVSKKYSAPFFVERFVQDFDLENFSISSFSLDSLSTYLLNNFEFDPAQSAVLATKLNETFERFNMQAHPSYFAGISSELLAGLINANRRVELIQLAVEGALMILVAADTSDVHVSRRWRREYLKEVIFKQYVCGEVIDEARAITLAKDMAESRDIEISAFEFVHSFVAAGIFEFGDSGIQFILVYVRDYLIAEKLCEKEETALRYFNFDQVDSDFNVLDIYSELGPSKKIVSQITELVETDIKSLNESYSFTRRILEQKAIRDVATNKFSIFSKQRVRISNAIKYVGENSADLEKKQQLLDVNRIVAEKASEINESRISLSEQKMLEENVFENDGQFGEKELNGREGGIKLDAIAAHWCAGVSLLSTGAERLEVGPKRRLAKGLVSLGVRIAEVWTAQIQTLDFDKIKSEVVESEEFQDFRDKFGDEGFEREISEFLGMLRYSLLACPLKVILHVLCGQTEGNVLRKTIRSTEVENCSEKLVQAVWSSDLDVQNAEEIMADPLEEIKRNYFLKIVLAEHFVGRVYWAKWKVRDRAVLLDVATKILESLNVRLNKEEIKKSLLKK